VTKTKRYQSGGDISPNEIERMGREFGRKQPEPLQLTPQFLALNKNFKGVGGRLAYEKALDKNSSINAYIDAMVSKPAGQSASVTPQKVGVEYRRSFAKGGVTASKRADGIAQRGKTRGKLV
jgi:hypothetical protein